MGGLPSGLPALLVWGSIRRHSCSQPGEVRWDSGGGQLGGGRGTGAAPSFLAPLRRRSRQKEELIPVSAGEHLASCPGGGGGQCYREGVTGCPAWPAPRLGRGRPASLPSAARASGARPRRPPPEYSRRHNCPLFWSYGPQPPLRALPRRLSSDQREAQASCWRLRPRTASRPPDRLAPAREGSLCP